MQACHLSIQEAEQEDQAFKASLGYKVKCCQNQKAVRVVLLRGVIVSFSPFSLCGAEVWTWGFFCVGQVFHTESHPGPLFFLRQGLAV